MSLLPVLAVELDCWDGPKRPRITHGHTFCTKEDFGAVAKAIGECAFVTSELPVILSLEMHCSPPQQNKIAKLLQQHLGNALLPVRTLSARPRPATPPPPSLFPTPPQRLRSSKTVLCAPHTSAV